MRMDDSEYNSGSIYFVVCKRIAFLEFSLFADRQKLLKILLTLNFYCVFTFRVFVHSGHTDVDL